MHALCWGSMHSVGYSSGPNLDTKYISHKYQLLELHFYFSRKPAPLSPCSILMPILTAQKHKRPLTGRLNKNSHQFSASTQFFAFFFDSVELVIEVGF